MNRLSFSRTQILILLCQRVANILIKALSCGLILGNHHLMTIVNEVLNFTPQMGTAYLYPLLHGVLYFIMVYAVWYLEAS